MGVFAGGQSEVTGNRVYSNDIGIQTGNYGFGGRIINNVIYDSEVAAVALGNGLPGSVLEFNTIHEPVADGITVHQGSNGVSIKNNIVSVGAGIAIQVELGSESSLHSDYNLFDIHGTAKFAKWVGYDVPDLLTWSQRLGLDVHSLVENPQFVDANGADNRLGYDATTGTDYSDDDEFHLLPSSPGIDRANPFAWYLSEPTPNGNRANIGAYGNTPWATSSPQRLVQVLSPNGHEKLEAESETRITWQTAGVTTRQPVALMNVGGGSVAY